MLRRTIFLSVILIVLACLGVFIFRDRIFTQNAGLIIEAVPSATVFLDGEQVGTTPFKLQKSPGNVEVKLIPFSQDTPLSPYQTEIPLVNGIETVLRRNFGPTEDESSGEVLYFEKIGGKTASISVVSNPDAQGVMLDGKSIGFTPLRHDVEEGTHILKISGNGVEEREVSVKTLKGYKLTAVIKLAQIEEETTEETLIASASASPSPQASPAQTSTAAGKQVEILTTPTGFLRVRSEASTATAEIGRVTPGNKYKLLDKNPDKSWFKIEYEVNKSGWVSAQYAKEITP